MVPGRSRIVFLDWLRIFAFVSVLAGHKFYPALEQAAMDGSLPWLARAVAGAGLPLIQAGGAGVVVFFLVSGYIITHVLRRETAGIFLVRRFFRIYPLYVVAVLLQKFLTGSTGASGAGELAAQLLLVGDFFGTPYALNGVEWTLRAEVLFYLYMAFCRRAGVFPAGASSLRYAGMPLMAAHGMVALACLAIGPVPRSHDWAEGYLTLYFPFLLLGSAVYLRQARMISRLAGAAGAAALCGLHFYLLRLWHPIWVEAWFWVIGGSLFLLALKLDRWLKPAAGIILLSDLTYAVYLFHNWFYDLIVKKLEGFPVRGIPRAALSLTGLLVFCYLMVRLVERPAVRLGRAVARRPFGPG